MGYYVPHIPASIRWSHLFGPKKVYIAKKRLHGLHYFAPKISCHGSGFCKTLRNHRDFGGCIWMEKVYTWLILVCSGQFLVSHCLHIVKIIVQMLWIYQRILLESTCLRFPMLWNTISHIKIKAKSLWLYSVYTKFDQSLHQSRKKNGWPAIRSKMRTANIIVF